MDIRLANAYKDLNGPQEAAQIIRNCVHCGFCNATCPTYQLLGDELDGPRGRIYLVKSMLEGNTVGQRTQKHLDRCLTCRSCETTCPSGVKFGRLLEIGRDILEEAVERSLRDRGLRFVVRRFMTSQRLFSFGIKIARPIRRVLPQALKQNIPSYRDPGLTKFNKGARRMLMLNGCVQPALIPSINAAATRVLHQAKISVITPDGVGCCGALSLHLGATSEAKENVRKNIDAWWPEIENGCEAIVMTASGCGVTVREYGQLMATDLDYADKAKRISGMVRDLSEVLSVECPDGLPKGDNRPIVFHAPCTLQHGQQIQGQVEALLIQYGWDVMPVRDQHLCCGSAGSYSLFQSKISEKLLKDKLSSLEEGNPQIIASANIGCLIHLEKGARAPVRHWIELLDPELTPHSESSSG